MRIKILLRDTCFLSLLIGICLWQGLLSSPVCADEADAPTGIKKDVQTILTANEKKWLAAHPIIRIAGPKAFPPFHYFEEDGTLKGMASDYIKTIFDYLNLKPEIQGNLAWPLVLKGVREHNIDLISCSAKTADREAYLNFTEPYLSFPLVIVVRTDAPFIGGLEDLHGKKVAFIQGGAAYEWILRDNISVTPFFVKTPLEALKSVSFGKSQAHIENLAAATYLIRKQGLANLKIAAPTAYDNYTLHIAVRKDWPELVSMINKILPIIPPGQQTEIRDKWLTVENDYSFAKKVVFKWFMIFTGIGVTVFLIILLWNRRLSREIAHRTRVEEALLKSEIELKRQNTMLVTIFETAAEGICIWHRIKEKPFVRFTHWNRKMETLTGYDMAEINRLGWFKAFTPEVGGQEKVVDRMCTMKKGDRFHGEEWKIEAKGGVQKEISISASILTLEGEAEFVLAIMHDITEQKRYEENLLQTHKMKAIGTLAGGIAHEFNNVLGIILGNTELAMDDVPPGSPTHKFLSEVCEATLRGRDVVRELLRFSRGDTREKHPVDMATCLRNALALLKAAIPANVLFREDIPQTCHAVMGDETLIQQVVIHLCNNAVQSMENHGGTLEITLKNVTIEEQQFFFDQILAPGEYVRVSVSDTGHGIPDYTMAHIFDPFFTTKSVDKGSGLGLSVVHGIIKGHDGFIQVKSKPGAGTTVFCYFPVMARFKDQSAEQDQPPAQGTYTILLVDDEVALLNIGRQSLERLGYIVETESNPVEALTRFKAHPEKFDLVITDMSMPQMTGDQLIKALLAVRPDIKTIICTGYNKKIDEKKADGIGAWGYIMKPMDRMVLAQTVQTVLNSRRGFPKKM